MHFDTDVTACAALVERADPVRFRAVMAAPVAARPILFPLYAFNAEVARAPWVTQEAMIAEMRLQWWRDALEEITEARDVRRHEVTIPLARVITPDDATLLDELVAARRWDIYRDPFEDQADMERYINQTAGHLMVVAARRLGQADESVVRDAAYAAGVAAWLRAIPALEAAKRVPLVDGTGAGVKALAQEALDRLHAARAKRGHIERAAAPALWGVAGTDTTLRAAIRNPARVSAGQLPQADAPFARVWAALSGRW